MQVTASNSESLNGRAALEVLMGKTPDISEYIDFGFYDWVMYKKHAGLGETTISRFLGAAEGIGSLLSYWILPKKAIPVVRTTVQ